VEQSTLTAVQKSAACDEPLGLELEAERLSRVEGIVRGLKQALIFGSMDELGTRPVIERAGAGNSRPKRKKTLMLCRLLRPERLERVSRHLDSAH